MPKSKSKKQSKPRTINKSKPDEKSEGEDYGREGTPAFGGKIEIA